MRIVSGKVPRSRYLRRGIAELNREAQKRLQWFDHYESHGRNAALTCRYFGISRQTFYRWKGRYDRQQHTTLEDRSHRPVRRRRPTWIPEQAERVRRLRDQYPRWGKDKLAVLLRRQGWRVSVSMVGRILLSLRQRGALPRTVLFRVKRRRGTVGRPWALRKPKDCAVCKPGDLVQLDTLDLRPSPKHRGEAIHGTGYGLTLGRHRSPSPGHLDGRHIVPGHPAAPSAFSLARLAGRWRQ